MKFTTALGVALPLVAAQVSYDGYKAFHIEGLDDYEGAIAGLSGLEYVTLSCQSDHTVLDIAVAAESLEAFESLGFESSVIAEDLGADIALEGSFEPYQASNNIDGLAAIPDISYFQSFHNFEDHLAFLTDLQASFPSNSKIFTVGNSVEGRPIQGIHLDGRGGPGTKPAVVWHGTVHAREWISGVTVEYMAYKIVQGYQANNQTVVSTLDNFDFYILPIVNPDGFVYTTTNDRLWRKNRQVRSGVSCVGTDVNRNWPYKWNIPGGSSTNPCSETYRGLAQGDTPENANLVKHTLSLSRSTGIKLFIDWHAFSQLILLPYGFDCSAVADNLDAQMALAAGVAEAIKAVNGLSFTYGPTCQTIYQTAGGSNDWAYDVAGAELAWAYELRPRAGSSGGFVIPPSNIVPSGEENWAGMLRLFTTW